MTKWGWFCLFNSSSFLFSCQFIVQNYRYPNQVLDIICIVIVDKVGGKKSKNESRARSYKVNQSRGYFIINDVIGSDILVPNSRQNCHNLIIKN